jgi:RNase P subunit RPR2
MSVLSTICPTTGKPFSTGVHADSRTLAKIWFSSIYVTCPHCGQQHAIKVREAYVDAVMSEGRWHDDFYKSKDNRAAV